MGRGASSRRGPEPSGIVCVNKPAGVTSRAIVDLVGRAFQTRRAGHAGTLDPLATGVLLVCLGKGTRLVPWLQEGTKHYRGRFVLGRTSDTDDATGNVIERLGVTFPEEEAMREALMSFRGVVSQVPPAYSAVHVEGRRAYELARAGEEVRIEPKQVRIDRAELSWYRPPEFELEVECGSGTYIRSIGRDLGVMLGCGALMTALVRERVGPFGLEDSVSVEQLEQGREGVTLFPLSRGVAHLPGRVCDASAERFLRNGRALRVDDTRDAGQADGPWPPKGNGDKVALFGPEGELWAMTEWNAEAGLLQPRVVFLE